MDAPPYSGMGPMSEDSRSTRFLTGGNLMNYKRPLGLAIFAASLLTAVGCGGGGGTTPPVSSNPGGGGISPTPSPSPTSSSSVTATNVGGTVVQIPSDAYGPAT